MSEPLGSAVTDEFPQAVGLHELLGGRAPVSPPLGGGGAPPPPAPAAPPVELPKDLLRNTLTLLDAVLSTMVLGVEPEAADRIGELERVLTPLAAYYAQGHPGAMVLWSAAAVGVAGYAYSRYDAVQRRRAAEAQAARDRATGPDTPAPTAAPVLEVVRS